LRRVSMRTLKLDFLNESWFSVIGLFTLNSINLFEMNAGIFKRILLLAVLMSSFLQKANAQRPYADSLKTILNGTSDPNRKVDLLCEIAYDLFDFDDGAAEIYANQALKLAEENNYRAGRKYALTIIGLGNFSLGDYQEALRNLHASKKIIANQRPELTGYNLMLMGSTYRDLANYDSAEYYYKAAIQTVGENGDPYYLGFFYRGLAHVKLIQWKNKEALEVLAVEEEILWISSLCGQRGELSTCSALC